MLPLEHKLVALAYNPHNVHPSLLCACGAVIQCWGNDTPQYWKQHLRDEQQRERASP